VWPSVLVDHAALLQGDALDGTGRPPESPAALREELDRLRQSAAAAQTRTEDVAALAGRVARLEGHLAREQARSAEAQAQAERDRSWPMNDAPSTPCDKSFASIPSSSDG
jgi:hypothetical protein